jgi:hypothetical protein
MPFARSTSVLRTDVNTYLLDGDLIVFDERRARLFALNSTASFIWSSLADGLSVEVTADQLSEATGVPAARAKLDIELLLAQWRDAQLLRDHSQKIDDPLPPLERVSRTLRTRRAPRGVATVSRSVRLMDRGIHVVGDTDLAGAIDSVFGRSVVPDSQAGEEWPTLEVVTDGDRWVLLLDHTHLAECADRAEIVPMIYGNAAKLVYEAADCFAAVHAAAVAKGSTCVLMPAVSTSGKSTLTAALIASGYEYCTDDLAILTSMPTRLRPVPMQIGLKTGSWEVLAAFYPELASLPTHRRPDGQLVKYLQPAAHGVARSSDERLQVVAVVFPKFVRGSATQLRQISRAEALTRMAEAGYDLSGKLDRYSVEALVQWFETLQCYELQFESLGEAVESFANVLA